MRYELPEFLNGVVDRPTYARWLQRRAQAHVKRDRKRWRTNSSVSEYKVAIHDAVLRSRGRDFYTNERLEWRLTSTYSNSESKAGGSAYKAKFALLPTVDHVDPNRRALDFEVCGWRTNDCKNDLSLTELKRFCRKVLKRS